MTLLGGGHTLPAGIRLDGDALIYQPSESELCRFYGSPHRADDDGRLDGSHIAEPLGEVLSQVCALVPPELGELWVAQGVVLCSGVRR